MQERFYSLAGTPFAVASADARLLDAVEEALGPLREDASAPAEAFRCASEIGDPATAPPGSRIHFEGMAPFDAGFCILGEDAGRRFLVFPDRLSLVAPDDRRVASAIVKRGEERAFTGLPLMHLLDWVLESDAQTLLHGAALADASGTRGLFLFAPSGAGKTTLSLALLKAGFRLYSDDLAVLSRHDGIARIGGLARSAKVHTHTARLMPWLNEYLGDRWDANGEQALDPTKQARIGRLAKEPVPLVAIIHLAGRGPAHSLTPAPASETLMRLFADNLRIGQLGVPEFQLRTFRRLGTILSGVPTFDFIAGSDLATAAPMIAEVIAPDSRSGARRGERYQLPEDLPPPRYPPA